MGAGQGRAEARAGAGQREQYGASRGRHVVGVGPLPGPAQGWRAIGLGWPDPCWYPQGMEKSSFSMSIRWACPSPKEGEGAGG